LGAIYYKTESEIQKIHHSSLIVSNTIAEVGKYIEPGISTAELDKIAESYIISQGAKPAFKGYRGFPGTLCVSVNEQIVHGMPGEYKLKEGDIISVDCGAVKDGFYGDSAYTFGVGKISEEARQLLRMTKEALYLGVEAAIEGNRVGDISAAVQEHEDKYRYGVVRELVGHGIGRTLHEGPDVPNYGRKGNGMKLMRGLVIAIEPMINMGRKEVRQEKDGWTIVTQDGMPSAHFEHTVAIAKGKPEILTTFEIIEQTKAAQLTI
jgi:methionyl aminopeptidase